MASRNILRTARRKRENHEVCVQKRCQVSTGKPQLRKVRTRQYIFILVHSVSITTRDLPLPCPKQNSAPVMLFTWRWQVDEFDGTRTEIFFIQLKLSMQP